MADITGDVRVVDPQIASKRFRDMGDGTHAPVGVQYPLSDYPADAVPLAAASGNVANAAATATLAASATKFNYLTGFEITGGGATAAALVAVTVTGCAGGTLTYTFAVPAGAAVGATPLVVQFPKPLKSSAVNTAIAVSAAAFGAGNTNAAAVAHGYQL